MLSTKRYLSVYIFTCKDRSNDDVGVSRDAVFQEVRPGEVGFETGDFVEEKLGGATIERLFFYFVPKRVLNHGLLNAFSTGNPFGEKVT